MSDYSIVQPIIVKSDEATHEATVLAVAMASLSVYDAATEAWVPWLAGHFTKTVRRAKASHFQKVHSFAVENHLPFSLVETPHGSAIAFEPMTYEAMPAVLRKCQVSGTDFPREEKESSLEMEPTPFYIAVNDDLNMTTGKCAAQVAHGYWIAFLGGALLDSASSIPPVVKYYSSTDFETLKPLAERVVKDAGLTEFDEPTETVLVI